MPCSGCTTRPLWISLRRQHRLGGGLRPRQHRSFMSVARAAQASAGDQGSPSNLLQYVVLRKDLWNELEWPLGSIVAQGCHAATAALWLTKDEAATQQYCNGSALDCMHKVVLEIKGETQLRNLASKLQEAGVQHKLWIEQPENYATCLATAPCNKADVQQHFKKYQLARSKS